MKIKDAMTSRAEYLSVDTTLEEAAQKMRELDCGFLPIGVESEGKLEGVITDRDIVIRAVAEGLDPRQTTVGQIRTDKVLYCYEGDDLDKAAENMRDQQVHRMVVLNDSNEKRLSGVISFGDLVRHNGEQQAVNAARGICA